MENFEGNNGAYYVATAEEFRRESRNSGNLCNILKNAHEFYRPNESLSGEQIRSWESSFPILRKLLENADLRGDQVILLEALLKQTKRSMDVVLCGTDENGTEHVSILELKTWHTSRRRGRRYDIRPLAEHEKDTRLLISLHTREDDINKIDVVDRDMYENPRLQVRSYMNEVRHHLKNLGLNQTIPTVASCVVLYNCTKLSQLLKYTLECNLEEKWISNTPIVTKHGCDGSLSLDQLANNLNRKHCTGNGWDVYEKISEACLL